MAIFCLFLKLLCSIPWGGYTLIYLTASLFFLNKFTYLIIYFWLLWVFVAARGLSLAVGSGAYSWLQCAVFSLQWLLLLQSVCSRRVGFRSCGTQAQ